MLQATVLAVLDHLGARDTAVTCDELAEQVGVGRGRVIAACDRLHNAGYVVKDRGIVTLTGLAIATLSNTETEAA
jgi:DNA-binding IclR family transcriptional regulator